MVAEYLWEFAHQSGLAESLVTRALEEHLNVVSMSGRESCRTTFIQRCLNDMREVCTKFEVLFVSSESA